MKNYKYHIVLSIMLFTSACSTDSDNKNRMNIPLEFENPTVMMQKLSQLESQIGPQNYIKLTDAIAHLKAYDLDNNSLDGFYLKLSGLTPQEIIAKAQNNENSN